MGNLFPLLRDTADYTHKLWDHLFIMSDFQLDVDSPYPLPSREDLTIRPRPLKYNQGPIRHKHYGKYLERMVRKVAEEREQASAPEAVDCLARYMRTKSYEYNQEHPSNETLIKDLRTMSDGLIEVDEESLNNLRNDYKQNPMARQQRGFTQRGQRPQQKNRPQQHGRNHAKNNARHRN
jgi:hypothetical protein